MATGRNSTGAVDLKCPACGYNLGLLTSRRCPECGQVFEIAESKTDVKKKHLMRSLGEFVGHIWRGVTTDPRNDHRKDKRVLKKTVEEEERDGVTLRRTTIEEVEFRKDRD
jgi:hypothetical protein